MLILWGPKNPKLHNGAPSLIRNEVGAGLPLGLCDQTMVVLIKAIKSNVFNKRFAQPLSNHGFRTPMHVLKQR